jgi:DNA modification methylase
VKPYYEDDSITLYHGDSLAVLRELPDQSVDCCVTSPPYFGLRSYLPDDHPDKHLEQGTEETPAEYVARMVAVFHEIHRVLADDGTLWLNVSDTYTSRADSAASETRGRARTAAMSPRQNTASTLGVKQLLGIPWRLAFALQDDGWILRSEIIWAKPNPNPEKVKDRPTSSHEQVFLMTKKRRDYFYDWTAIAEDSSATADRPQLVRARQLALEHGLTEEHFAAARSLGMSDAGKAALIQGGSGRNSPETIRLAQEAKSALGGYFREFLTGELKNARTVWTVPVAKFSEAHFATMPVTLAERCVQAGCKPDGVVLDPFSGSGTTGLAAAKHGRRYVGIDLSADYLDLSLRTRLAQSAIDFGESA